jgi:hypothetical protein
MADTLQDQQQKKILRGLVRLKHSLAADREIYALLEDRERLGTEGVVPQLETTLGEILSGRDES